MILGDPGSCSQNRAWSSHNLIQHHLQWDASIFCFVQLHQQSSRPYVYWLKLKVGVTVGLVGLAAYSGDLPAVD